MAYSEGKRFWDTIFHYVILSPKGEESQSEILPLRYAQGQDDVVDLDSYEMNYSLTNENTI